MSIQQEFIVRYRGLGHIRFQVPERICVPLIASALESQLNLLSGVSYSKLYLRQAKFAIHFDESEITLNALVLTLNEVLARLESQGHLVESKLLAKRSDNDSKSTTWSSRSKVYLSNLRLSRWVKDKYTEAKETAQAAKIITKLSLKKPKSFLKDPEQTLIDFLNDILVLYLIKIHWRRITKEWIPSPFKYRYEWLAVWYLFFLLMRSRLKKNKQ